MYSESCLVGERAKLSHSIKKRKKVMGLCHHTKPIEAVATSKDLYHSNCYVLWVRTGQEEKASSEICSIFSEDVTPMILTVETFFRKKGKVKKEIHLAFPGYIFITTEISNDEFIQCSEDCIRRSSSLIRLLCYGDSNEAAMRDEDREAIRNLWQGKNCLEVSIGFIEGEHVFITEGSFVGRESVIKEIHPRRHEAIVEIEFMGGIRRMSIGLEIIKRLK